MLAVAGVCGSCLVVHTSLTKIGSTAIFAGEVKNSSGNQILAHNVHVDFLDGAGNVVDAQDVRGCLDSLQVGASDFFEARSSNPAVVTARARVSADGALRLGIVQTGGLAISGVGAVQKAGTLTVNGTIANPAPTTVSAPKVCAVLRSSSNDVLRVASQTLDAMPPQGMHTFSLSFAAPPGMAATSLHVDTWVDGLLNGTPEVPASSLGISVQAGAPSNAAGCAFSQPPTTYEAPEDRRLYLEAMDLAAFNMLTPGDPYFSRPSIYAGTRTNRTPLPGTYVPPTLLKAISWIETDMAQGARSLPFGAIGPALIAFDCGVGLTQVTSGMTAPLGEAGQPTDQQALVATHFAYNIARGAALLVDNWNAAPANRPIVGIDTNSDPSYVENWYYAVWGYNGFTGPGTNRSNHPLDPVYGAWPRSPYSCGPANDGLGHNRSLYPYQELVYGCMAHPPNVLGQPLWAAISATLPDLNNPYWRKPLDLSNFQYPFSGMDLPTPKPDHLDPSGRPGASTLTEVLGEPVLSVDHAIALVTETGGVQTPAMITIANAGTGIEAWRVSANKPWVRLSQQAGVAVGPDLPCASIAPCERTTSLVISIDPAQVLSDDSAVISVRGLAPNASEQDIALFVRIN